MLVQDFLYASVQRLPDKTALVCGDRRFSYAEIDTMTNRLGNALLAAGVRRGDRVALFLDNSVEAVVGIFATLKAGGVFVVVHPTTKTPIWGGDKYYMSGSVSREYFVSAIPVWMVIDKSGLVKAPHMGYEAETRAILDEAIGR